MTGDDFGLSAPVNEAIVKAHETGILTTASLMVSAAAAKQAVALAKKYPGLNVGMHLVLSNGKSILPHTEIHTLVNANGAFDSNPVRSSIMMFFDPQTRRHLEREIQAQFESFKRTGLKLDHVNAHNHLHIHPTVFDLIIKIGQDYGLTAIRIPDEPPLRSIIDNRRQKIIRVLRWCLLKPFVSRMKKRCRENNIRFNDRIYGLHDSGHMQIEKLVRIIPHIQAGLTELYCHPATAKWDNIDAGAKDYEFEAEYKALIHARTKSTIEKFDIELSGFNK